MIDKKTIDIIKLSKVCEEVLANNSTKNSLLKDNAEYFIKNFLTAKETNIPNDIFNSSNYKIEFEIYKSKNMIWDLFFISEYILEQLPEDSIKKIEKTASSDVKISLKNINPLLVLDKTSEYKDLKKSLVISDLLYKYLYDSNYKDIIEDNNLIVEIYNSSYKIPIEYLGEYNRGIIPLNIDKSIAEKVDKKVLTLFYNLNIDFKELPNFYYRVNIDRLNYLNELVNNNQDKLNTLPAPLFISSIPVSRIKKLLKLVDNNINKLSKLPISIFVEQTYTEYIKSILELTDNDFDKLSKLPIKVFSRSTNIERINTIIKNTKNKKISELNNLPNGLFICSDKRLQFFTIRTKSNLTKIKGIAPQAFSSQTTEERLQLLINLVNENYKLLEDININTYTTTNKRLRFILQLIKNDISKLKLIPDTWFNEKTTSEKRIKYLYNLMDKDIDITISLPEVIFNDSITNEERIEYLYNLVNKDIDILKTIPQIAFDINVSTTKIEELYNITNNQPEELKYIPKILFQDKINLKEYNDILSILTNKKELTITEYKLLFPFIKDNNEDKKFIYQRLFHLIKNIKDIDKLPELPEHLFRKYTSNIRITFLLDLIKHDINKLSLIPKELYLKHIKVTRIVMIYNIVGKDFNKLSNLPKEMYTFPKESLNYLYELHLNNKVKPLIGIGDSKTIITILYMLIAFSEYKDSMSSPNQLFSKFTITKPSNILVEESSNIKECLYNINEVIQKLPKILCSNNKKDFKPKLIKDIKKVNTSILYLDKVISNHNNKILLHIKDSLLNLRFHINGENIILEDYEVLEDSYRNHTFKIEGKITDYIELTKSLLVNKRLISTKEYTEEIYNRLSSDTKKTYGKRFINTLLNETINYKKKCSSIISAQSKLSNHGITDITFYLEDNVINIGYMIGNKKHYSEMKDLQKDLIKLIK